MPKTKFLSRSGREHFREGDGDGEDSAPHVLQVYKDCDSDEEIQGKAFQSVVYLSAGKGDTLYGMSDSKGHSAKNTVKNKITTDIIPLLADGLHSSPTGSADAGVRRHEVSLSPQHSSNSSSSPAFPQATPCKGVKGKHAIQKSGKKGALSDRVFCTETDCKSFGLRVIAAKRADSCFFCLKSRPQVLVPACIGWLPHPETSPSDTGIPMCTPYTEMIRVRDEALAAANMAQLGMVEAVVKSDAAEAERSVACASMAKMQKRMGEMEAAMMQLVKSCDSQVSAEKKQRDADVQSIIAQHNLQLSELKRLHKAIAAKQSASAAAALSMVSASTSSQQELNASTTHPSVCQSAGTAPSHPFRAVQGASLHPAPMPHPALHSNRTSVVPSKLLATHPGHSNETTRHASHPAVHHPTPPTYSTTQTSHLSVSSQQHVKPVQSRSEQQQGGESMTQGLPGPNGVFLQSDSPTQPQTQVAAIFIKSQGNIDRTGISADGRALNSEHTMRAPLHSSKTLDGSYEHCGGLESSSMSAGRDARTEGHLQLSSLLHVTPSESYSGMISTTIAPGTFDPRHESYEELTIDSATQNGLYAPSIHRLLQSSDRHTDHSYNASFLMETQDFDHYRYMNNQTQYFPGEVAAYSALQRSHAPEEAESSVDAHRPMSCDSLNPYYKYSGGDSFSSQRQQSDEVDLNDAESRYMTELHSIGTLIITLKDANILTSTLFLFPLSSHRFWLPSLDFDEIQQLLHQELRYPTPGTSPKTVKDSDEFPTIH